MGWPLNAAKIYRTLLLAYPAEFRHEYGPEMAQLFENRLRSERPLRLWLDVVADIALSAPKEHWSILVSDIRYGVRMLGKMPGFTLIALLVIALGIGATTSIFSLVNAVLLRAMPYGDAGQLAYLWSPNERFKGPMVPQEFPPSDPDFYDWQRLNRSFSSMAMVHEQKVNLVQGGSVTRSSAALVTGSFFSTLEVNPELGRAIDAGDDQPGHAKVAVISDGLWRNKFNNAPDAIGQTLHLDREKYTVIGVMPREFGYPFEGDIPYGMSDFGRTDIWIPMALSVKEKTDRVNFVDSSDAVIGRVRPGVTVKQAEADLKSIEARLSPLYPAQWQGSTAMVRPMVRTIVGPVQEMLWLLVGAVGVVLLIACSNVANLLLARVTARAHEMGVRGALGAERARLIRQLFTESLLLACLGGAAGVVLAVLAVHVIVRLNPGNIPRFEETSVDGTVLLVTLAISVAAGLLFGLGPALTASRVNVIELLKQSGSKGSAGTSSKWRHSLIVTQVALSVVLLAGAGLLIRSYLRLEAANPGFSLSTLTFRLALDNGYSKPEQRTAFFRRFLDGISEIPGVVKVGAANAIPLDHYESVAFLDIKGFGKPKELIDDRLVTPDYFEAIGMRLLAGRYFNAHDIGNSREVSIVNESFAKAYLRGSDPLSRQIRGSGGDFSGVPWSRVVGVVSNLRHSNLEETPRPEVFRPYWPGQNNEEHFAVKASVRPERLISSSRKVLHDLDPALALEDVRTMSERVSRANAKRRFQTVLLTSFAGLAVSLAMVGLYGLLAYAVRQRTPEIGLRMALGASRGQVLAMVLRQGLGLVALGLGIGMFASLGLLRLLRGWLYETRPADPVTFAGVLLLVFAVALCACVVPALQATRVDPTSALRYE
ncbi:MAG: ABC transporter permease [Bryobacteraceae bacterium]